jgi:nucleotidyltransferase/DNA polymerase involved in DNA repair
MRWLLYVALPGFYLHNLGPPPHSGFRVVLHEKRVIEACAGALLRGAYPGMSESEVKTLLQSEAQYLIIDEEQLRPARNAWLDLGLDFADAIEPESPASAWFDLTAHPRPAEVADAFLRHLVEKLPYSQLVSGLASNRWVAKLAAQLIHPGEVPRGIPCIESVTNQAAFLAPLPTERLVPVAPEHRQRLIALGYRRIGEVASAANSLLRRPFGEDALKILASAQGKWPDPIRACYPPASWHTCFQLEEPITNHLVLESIYQDLAEAGSQALIEKDEIARHIWLKLECESGRHASAQRPFGKPTREGRAMNTLLSLIGKEAWNALQLDNQEVEEGVAAVHLRLLDLIPAPRVPQALPGTYGNRERAIAAETALRRVKGVHGDQAVIPAALITLSRRDQLLRLWRQATGWR